MTVLRNSLWTILPLAVLCAAGSAAANTVVLYDAAAGGGAQTPADQGFLYLTNPMPPLGTPDATLSAAGGLTTLNTQLDRSESAGFLTHNPFDAGGQLHPSAPVLDRSLGFTISFQLRMLGESHDLRDDNSDLKYDRAGFSVLVVTSDLQALELGFFHNDAAQNEIWAYEDDQPGAGFLFTQAEGVDRSAAQTGVLTDYDLTVNGGSYELFAGGLSILSGSLRDYTSFTGPMFPLVGELNPYNKANLLFFGDDTSSADAQVQLGTISVTTVPEPSAALLLLLGAPAVGLLLRRQAGSRRL